MMRLNSKAKRSSRMLIILMACLIISGSIETISKSNDDLTIDEIMFFSIKNNSTLYVGGDGPNNYSKIQDAIDNASDGDTIFVYSGEYQENIQIDKSISLIGENVNTTLIIGKEKIEPIINVTADKVKIKGFTITNSSKAGIILYYSNVCNISKNIVKNIDIGIYLYYAKNNMIFENIIQNYRNYGIWLKFSSNNWISKNEVMGNNQSVMGVVLSDGCKNNFVQQNIISNNNAHGIYVGISFFKQDYNSYPEENTILDNDITDNNDGIFLVCTNNNTIEKNNITYSRTFDGIWIDNSCNNTIQWNNIAYNARDGIRVGNFYGFCRNNTIAYNNLIENREFGVSFFKYSNNNYIHHNNFLCNHQNAYDACLNIWNSENPREGNYWSDYNGVDKDPEDGIGDTPYDIPGGSNKDNYPLIMPHENIPFYVKIITPQKGFYFMNRKIMSCSFTLIVGKINITVIAFNEKGIKRVEFYLDDKLQKVLYYPPYYWLWGKIAFSKHIIKVVAFNDEGKYRADEIIVWKFF